ncbi:MAG TPA: DUF3971 domain-containing protein, partial [Methylibium sp.]|nr:DUF3971 domain-containing protein [Methylibium sp.]
MAGLRGLAYGLLALASIASVLWLVLQWGILPRIESWRPALEQRASAALGLPVRIGALRAVDRGLGWTGGLELDEVVLLHPRTQQEALRLPRVRATVSASSLLPGWDGAWRLRFRQVLIDAPMLDMRRDAEGRLSVAGIEVGHGTDADGALADWFFSQHEFAIRGGSLQWHDAQRAAPPLALRAVDLVVRNGVRRHELRLDATPPAEWGERFSLRGEFVQPLLASGDGRPGLLARPGDWRRWRGTAYAELPAIDLAPLRPHLTLPLEPTAGRGALRAWVDVRDARVEAATADARLQGLSLKLAADAVPVVLTRLDGRVAIERTAAARGRDAGWSLALKRLAFASADGLDWPAGDLMLAWRLGADGRPSGGELTAPKLDLGRLAAVLSRLPPAWTGAELQARLAALAPRGEANALSLAWDGPADAPRTYRAAGRVKGLVLAAGTPAPAVAAADTLPARPGVEGLDLEFRATEDGGEATLALRGGALDFPGVFESSRIALAALDTRVDWKLRRRDGAAATDIEARVRDLRLANDDLEGRFDAVWTGSSAASGDAPGVLDLSGKLSRAAAASVPRYLPLVVGDEVRSYLRRALQGGRAFGVAVRLRGDLADFPFPQAAQGEFRVAAQLDGVRFAYMPAEPDWAGDPADVERRPWPAFGDVHGELLFDRQTMQLKRLSAALPDVGSGGLALREVAGGIADLGAAAPRLKIDGRARGALDDALRYLNATPIGGWIGDALVQASASGGSQAPIELQLGLEIPLDGDDPTRVRGALQLAGNDLRLRPDVPLLAGARARIAFSDSGFTLTQGAARVLGGDAQFDGAQQPDGSLRFNVQGTLAAEAVKRAAELGPLARAAQPLSGQTGYKLALGFVRDQVEWQFRSELAGLAIDLPAPLGKRAEQALPLRAQAALQPAAAGALPRDLLRVEL